MQEKYLFLNKKHYATTWSSSYDCWIYLSDNWTSRCCVTSSTWFYLEYDMTAINPYHQKLSDSKYMADCICYTCYSCKSCRLLSPYLVNQTIWMNQSWSNRINHRNDCRNISFPSSRYDYITIFRCFLMRVLDYKEF